MNLSDVPNMSPEKVSQALAVGSGVSTSWRRTEFGSVLQFQMDAPLVLDLATSDDALRGELEQLVDESDPSAFSLKDLFFHARPSVSLLIRVKNFAKAMRFDDRHRLPPEVATVIYFAAIAVAKAKCSSMITELADADLRSAKEWIETQEWIDEPLKRLILTGLSG